jgi:hypothetical protein
MMAVIRENWKKLLQRGGCLSPSFAAILEPFGYCVQADVVSKGAGSGTILDWILVILPWSPKKTTGVD